MVEISNAERRMAMGVWVDDRKPDRRRGLKHEDAQWVDNCAERRKGKRNRREQELVSAEKRD